MEPNPLRPGIAILISPIRQQPAHIPFYGRTSPRSVLYPRGPKSNNTFNLRLEHWFFREKA